MSSQLSLGIAHDCRARRQGRPIVPEHALRFRDGLRCVFSLVGVSLFDFIYLFALDASIVYLISGECIPCFDDFVFF